MPIVKLFMKNIKESLFLDLKVLKCLFINHDITEKYRKAGKFKKIFKMNWYHKKPTALKIKIKRK